MPAWTKDNVHFVGLLLLIRWTGTTETTTATESAETMASIDDDAVAAADKEMEERANRAKELLSRRYKGMKVQQVCTY